MGIFRFLPRTREELATRWAMLMLNPRLASRILGERVRKAPENE